MCLFLEDMSAELRNEVYRLSFTVENHAEAGKTIDLLAELPYPYQEAQTPVDLFDAKPANKSLPTTYRQINEESRLIYRDAYRRYYTTQRFVANNEASSMVSRFLDSFFTGGIIALTKHDLNNIQHLSFSGPTAASPSAPLATKIEYTRMEDKRIWKCELSDGHVVMARSYCWSGSLKHDTTVDWMAEDVEEVAKAQASLVARPIPYYLQAVLLLEVLYTSD